MPRSRQPRRSTSSSDVQRRAAPTSLQRARTRSSSHGGLDTMQRTSWWAPSEPCQSSCGRLGNIWAGCMKDEAVELRRSVVVASSVPHSQSHGFYRSRTGSNEDDIRDLIRTASQRSKDHPITAAPRSQSVAVGVRIVRIDEDRQCDEAMCPRSRSVSVVEKRRVGALA
ncbi:uncharacterized protein A4U43_C03F23350 [Asparagus officinalis]|uniref:Uncharacterized protein n=1 Tax=Asparagus officinalis TaxID=4686 RepID=A0A5P1FHI6_ASPOF|nr:uncharacterized protein A4U43_C03F23350 [Asparagus officinalis]